ncbi:iron-sulfur cluster protector protein [Wigglesworthia glossinidia endosymbiont of Glossina morsitans morsitans (Yale colony)]|uniref:Probable Fe(2+)-trafficking protein n=1 Tax=Wigglesworthia glossinidia endosymbiont of Glossina morsitans morsitans (Yale colony) TaxID=1142511 RepID=H6Q5N6_WIGGL|nr:oxidative damage protection protein [Wigglesworthia glossinidia]AFA40940.1 iron-sulfur cluster protector protein [Wigglesworthia glossinidia endosymbiont of Glossina morsitans morsitans (Yale colony)]
MKKKFFCTFLNQTSEQLDFPPYPGALGIRIHNHISKEAWKIWQNYQTVLINEKKLNMININDRKLIEKKMIDFLFKKNQN